MEKYSLETLLPKAGGSVYRLVRMASMRALELSEGIPSLVEKHQDEKLTSVALSEIAAGKVELKGHESK